MKRAKSTKLKSKWYKPTPISRLSRYRDTPPRMVGDPEWRAGDWSDRCYRVYEDMMVAKRGGWTTGLYEQAHRDNERLDFLLRRKWEDYEAAMEDTKWFDHDEAWRDNAAWDYHHDNYLEHA